MLRSRGPRRCTVPQFHPPDPASTVSTMGILIGMMGSITIERLSLSTRLVSHSSLHSHIMGITRTDITHTDTTRTTPTGTTITGDPLTDTVTAVDPTS